MQKKEISQQYDFLKNIENKKEIEEKAKITIQP